jgi:hypothetical protein
MTSSARTDIFTLLRGHEFDPVTLAISPAQIDAYLRATGDPHDYGGSAPPLAAVALALQALQGQFALRDGTLHSGQEVEHHGAVPAGVTLTLRGRVAQRTERQGMIMSVVEYELSEGDRRLLRATSTIVTAAAG